MNEIVIKGLEVMARVGVPDAERKTPQRLLVDVVIESLTPFSVLDDDIARTVDYDTASRRIMALAAERPRRLIETLANEIAGMIVSEFPAARATVEVRKFILPNTECVAVRCSCERK